MPCSCKKCKPCPCVKPDLTFFYTVDITKGTIIDKLRFGNSILETVYGFITDKHNNNIGRIAVTKMNYDVNDVVTNVFFDSVHDVSFIFKDGNSISISDPVPAIKDSQGNYVTQSGVTNVYKIINGSGVYLNSTGYVVIKTNNLDRKVKIYFTNKHKK